MRLGEESLTGSVYAEKFYQTRDKIFEHEVKGTFEKLFKDDAAYYANAYETPDSQHEHDLIICWNDRLFVVEAKASPPVEPFRDPEKAYQRISQRFRSDRGIQKAFDQAVRIPRLMGEKEEITLFDEKGSTLVTLGADDFSAVYTVCVTRDDFGPLAVDLSLLLEKEEGDEYPWAINILDLEYLISGWQHLGWGSKKLCEYLDTRRQLHGIVITFDELDIAGYFIQHDGLGTILESGADQFFLSHTYADVFDKMYDSKKGGPEFELEVSEPIMVDLRKEL